MLIAINFHYVRPAFDHPYPAIYGCTPAQFEAQLALLSRVGEFVSAAQIRDAIQKGPPLPEQAFIITFDDGLREQFEHAWPVLQRLGIPAIFFINTLPVADETVLSVHKTHLLRSEIAPGDFVQMLQRHAADQHIVFDLTPGDDAPSTHYRYDTAEVARLKYLLNFTMPPANRDKLIAACFTEYFAGQEAAISRRWYMDTTQIAILGAQGCIGTHGHDHVPLGLLPLESAEEQITRSMSCLERWAGYRPYALSYPYGSQAACTPAVGDMAAGQGIAFAFTMERAGNRNLDHSLHLARFDNNDVPGGKHARWTIETLFDSIPAASWYRD